MRIPLRGRARTAVIVAAFVIAGCVLFSTTGASAAVSYVLLGRSNYAASSTNITNSAGTPLGLAAKSGYAPLWVNSTTQVARLNADYVNGYHASAFAKVTGKTGVIEAADAGAVCPSGTVATGGGGVAFDVDPADATKITAYLPLNYSGPDIDANGNFVPNSWIVDPVSADANTHIAAFVECYNPKGAVPGAATAATATAKVAASSLTKLKAQLAR